MIIKNNRPAPVIFYLSYIIKPDKPLKWLFRDIAFPPKGGMQSVSQFAVTVKSEK